MNAVIERQPMYLPQPEPVDQVEQRLMDGATFADWLCGECMGKEPFKFVSFYSAASDVCEDQWNLRAMPTPDVWALLMAASQQVRVLALDEIKRRYMGSKT